MRKIYYQSKSLTIVEKSLGIKIWGELSNLKYFQSKMIGGLFPNANEAWTYNPQNGWFECIQNKNGTASILKAFLAEKDINIKCTVAELNTARSTRFQFVNKKDNFLFNLKF